MSPPALNIPVLLKYRDADRSISERVVLVDTFDVREENGVPVALTHLRGVCTLRHARRTFRVDRIVSAADPETGEIIADLPKWFAAQLGKMAPARPAAPIVPPAPSPQRPASLQPNRTVVSATAPTRRPPDSGGVMALKMIAAFVLTMAGLLLLPRLLLGP